MPTALLVAPRPLAAPTGPKRLIGRTVLADDPSEVGAFLFDLDTLFQVARYETALVRGVARQLAASRGLDPLWAEVIAIELTAGEGAGNAIATLRRLAGRPETAPAWAASAGIDAAIALAPGVEETLRALRPRFKLGLVSLRDAAEAGHIVAALGLEHHFDAVVPDETAAGSSEPADRLRRSLARLHEPADSTVLIGLAGSLPLDLGRTAGIRVAALAPPGRIGSAPAALDLWLPDLAHVEGLGAGASAKYGDGFRRRVAEA